MRLCGNSPQVEFTGSIRSELVSENVSQSDVLLCVSSLETFAVPVIEAWACGIPVITLDSIPASRYCNETNGIVLREDDLVQLGSVMEKIHTHYDRYDKEKIAQFAHSSFGDDAIYQQLISIYKKFGSLGN